MGFKVDISDHEMALIISSLATARKIHGTVLEYDASYWLYRLQWWICSLMLGKDSGVVFKNRYLLESRLKRQVQHEGWTDKEEGEGCDT